jgi:hypothetical protein
MGNLTCLPDGYGELTENARLRKFVGQTQTQPLKWTRGRWDWALPCTDRMVPDESGKAFDSGVSTRQRASAPTCRPPRHLLEPSRAAIGSLPAHRVRICYSPQFGGVRLFTRCVQSISGCSTVAASRQALSSFSEVSGLVPGSSGAGSTGCGRVWGASGDAGCVVVLCGGVARAQVHPGDRTALRALGRRSR